MHILAKVRADISKYEKKSFKIHLFGDPMFKAYRYSVILEMRIT